MELVPCIVVMISLARSSSRVSPKRLLHALRIENPFYCIPRALRNRAGDDLAAMGPGGCAPYERRIGHSDGEEVQVKKERYIGLVLMNESCDERTE
jgi:hypothetical protein